MILCRHTLPIVQLEKHRAKLFSSILSYLVSVLPNIQQNVPGQAEINIVINKPYKIKRGIPSFLVYFRQEACSRPLPRCIEKVLLS